MEFAALGTARHENSAYSTAVLNSRSSPFADAVDARVHMHYWVIAKGTGVGILPTYAYVLGARVVPIDIGLHMQFDIWLTYHPDANKISRIRRLIDWLIASFDPKRFPWFKDEFIHPDDLLKAYGGEPLVNLFEGFISSEHNRSPNSLGE